MTEITVRSLAGQEMLDVIFPLLVYAFVPSPPLPDKEEWLDKYIQPREGLTYIALFEDGIPMTIAGSKAMTQQVRGALFGMSAICGVASMPQARRKGYAKRVMTQLLADLRAAGQPLSTLYPFRESFYERQGYVTFPAPQVAKFASLGLLPLLEKDLGGEVELSLVGDAYEDYRAYLRQVQQQIPCMAVPNFGNQYGVERRPSWLAQAKVDGQRVGIMVYKLTGSQINEFTMQVTRFHYSNAQGKYLLLQWIARHVDQARDVEIWLPPLERPETWLSDLRVKTELLVDHIPMGRVVDVAKIGGMQVGPGRFTVRISDPLCPWNEGIWQFESKDGRLQVSQAKKTDCELKIQALSALVYGTNDPGDFDIRGWGNPVPQIQTTMRSMFPPLLPYLGEIF
jgi:predicted acetyltransferase